MICVGKRLIFVVETVTFVAKSGKADCCEARKKRIANEKQDRMTGVCALLTDVHQTAVDELCHFEDLAIFRLVALDVIADDVDER